MHTLVVGLGKSGLAAVRFFLQQGQEVSVSEARAATALEPALLARLAGTGVRVETGGHSSAFFESADRVFVSPGVPLDIPALAAARARGIPVIGEMGIVREVLATPLVAVTGTNGKTTVCTLLGELFEASGKKTFVGGNIGTPVLEYLADGEGAEIVVAEVSSFQLDTVPDFAAGVGVLLNISPDHLDRYDSYEAYARSKFRLFAGIGPGQWAVLNGDDPEIAARPHLWPPAGACLFFGRRPSGRPGAFLRGKQVVLAGLPGAAGEEAYDLAATALASGPNPDNAMAAVLAARLMGCSREGIALGLARFRPLPHRLTRVAEIGGISYYDDSKATNIGAVAAALGAMRQQVILIAGGRDKGGDYGLLAPAMVGRVRFVVLLGEAREKMAKAWAGLVPLETAGDLGEAVRLASALARPGEAVLLSPACASFDMFTSYAHRGEMFREAVRELERAGWE